MKTLKKLSVGALILSVALLTFLAILSIWDVLASDVLWKSISTIGVVAFSSLIIIAAASALEKRQERV